MFSNSHLANHFESEYRSNLEQSPNHSYVGEYLENKCGSNVEQFNKLSNSNPVSSESSISELSNKFNINEVIGNNTPFENFIGSKFGNVFQSRRYSVETGQIIPENIEIVYDHFQSSFEKLKSEFEQYRKQTDESISELKALNSLNQNSDSPIKEQVKKLDPNAIIPTRGSKFAACKDLYSPIDTIVPAGKNLLIKTNIAIAWDNPEYYMQILSRSGLCYKYNTVVQAGVCDQDFRNNVGVLLQNNSDVDFVIRRNDRIGQYTFVKIATIESEEVEEFTIELESNRNGGGFGSTGR